LSGNATINSHLTLSSVKPTADVVLTAGGAYTLTGTGVLSGGSLLAKANTDLTGMTGELGSVVTGSPALNLGSFTGDLPVGVTGGSGLDADGGNTPSWKATLSAATSALSTNTWTKVSCNVEAWDTDNAYIGGTFTVPSGESGKYVLYGSAYFSKSSVNRPRLSFYVGGSRVFTRAAYDEGVDIAGYPELTIYTVLPINAGVTVEFYAWASESGVAVYGTGNLYDQPSSFGGFKLRGV
jgi:hypothetical protein